MPASGLVRDDECLRAGASLSYYAVFSIFPLLLVTVTVVGFVLGHSPDTRARLLDSVASATSPAFRTLFDGSLHDMQVHETARGVSAVVGVVTLFVGASAVFSELETDAQPRLAGPGPVERPRDGGSTRRQR